MFKMIQSRHVPEALDCQLQARAALADLPLSDDVIREARESAECPTPEEMRERLKGRAPYSGRMAASDLVRGARASLIVNDASAAIELVLHTASMTGLKSRWRRRWMRRS